MELPDIFRNALKILRLVDIDESRFAFIIDCKLGKSLLHEVVSGDGIAGDELSDLGRLQQMQRDQLLSQETKPAEQLDVGGQGHPGEVDLQEFGVALAVGMRAKVIMVR